MQRDWCGAGQWEISALIIYFCFFFSWYLLLTFSWSSCLTLPALWSGLRLMNTHRNFSLWMRKVLWIASTLPLWVSALWQVWGFVVITRHIMEPYSLRDSNGRGGFLSSFPWWGWYPKALSKEGMNPWAWILLVRRNWTKFAEGGKGKLILVVSLYVLKLWR